MAKILTDGRLLGIGLIVLLGLACTAIAQGQEDTVAAAATEPSAGSNAASPDTATAAPAPAPPTAADVKLMVDTVWVMVTAMLVFFMNLGFACVESGMCRQKNCVNILSKNFIVFAVTTIGFWLLGFGLMFGNGSPYIGKEGLWMVNHGEDTTGVFASLGWTSVPLWAKFFFQLVFAGTAATIVSGAVAERIKYHSFILFSFIMALAIYPVVGHWIWGGGFLQNDWGFLDFAGSTQVHSIGGWAALAGVLILGPRIGKYGSDGKVHAIPGHNLSLATIGCFVLWFGWFGFNPGSTMAADPAAIAEVAVTTNLAAAAATLTATITAWLLLGKPDLGMTLNGSLAGLVAITAPCAFVTAPVSIIIGAIAGVLVVLGVLGFDRIKVDDPVGATSVHLLNGVFGTLCVGIFAEPSRVPRAGNAVATATGGGWYYTGDTKQLVAQILGVASCAAYVFIVAAIAWVLLKATVGIRVSAEEEIDGLDHGEHGNEAYHGFQFIREA
jgi:Amt family ammonium transporter